MGATKSEQWPRLSRDLKAIVDQWEFDQRKDETDDERSTRHFVEKMLRVYRSSVETFSQQWVERLHNILRDDPEWLGAEIDAILSKEAVDRIDDAVDTLLSFDPVLVTELPKADVSLYLKEATRCYLFGFNQGTVALCRAAIELALDERLSKAELLPPTNLQAKIKLAKDRKLIDEDAAILAHAVRKAGKTVLHKQAASAKNARDALDATRGALIRFYK
jgi:hypothetical protein